MGTSRRKGGRETKAISKYGTAVNVPSSNVPGRPNREDFGKKIVVKGEKGKGTGALI